ncbi:MAG: hypothetical protein H7831_04565 [Magnetococcus sp. WYHC-3]
MSDVENQPSPPGRSPAMPESLEAPDAPRWVGVLYGELLALRQALTAASSETPGLTEAARPSAAVSGESTAVAGDSLEQRLLGMMNARLHEAMAEVARELHDDFDRTARAYLDHLSQQADGEGARRLLRSPAAALKLYRAGREHLRRQEFDEAALRQRIEAELRQRHGLPVEPGQNPPRQERASRRHAATEELPDTLSGPLPAASSQGRRASSGYTPDERIFDRR